MPEQRDRICGIENCRSRRYHVGDDGYTYCSNGHRSETQVLTIDDDLAGAGARRTRKAAEVREKEVVTFEGRQALELYLQCFQLVLWKQVYWLVHSRGYPAELETVVHDLWQLRLQLLRKLLQDDAEQDAPAQYFSSQGESEDDTDASMSSRKIRIASRSNAPRLIESEWVLADGFPYIRATRAIPKAMRLRLPVEMMRSLHAQTGIGDLEKLHNTSMGLAGALKTAFDMEIPKLNHALILYRFMTELCLPLPVHPSTLALIQLLSFPLDFSASTTRYSHLSSHPELQLLAAFIVTVKLLYPFDNVVRYPTTAAEPAALKLDWSAWNELHLQSKSSQSRLRRRSSTASQTVDISKAMLDVQEADVLTMSGAEVDAYLDWYGRTWIDDEKSAGAARQRGGDVDFRNALYKMFPVDGPEVVNSRYTGTRDGEEDDEDEEEDSPHVQRLKSVTASLTPVPPRRSPSPSDHSDGEEDIQDSKKWRSGRTLRPGSQYRQYRSWSELPEMARPFFEAAAGLACIGVQDLVKAVFQVEMKVRKWVRAEDRERGKGKEKEARGTERSSDEFGVGEGVASSPP